MASPHVAGAAAILKSVRPTWTNVQIRERLQAKALDLGTSGRDDVFGFGLVDVSRALPLLAPRVRFRGCTGFAGSAELEVTTKSDATTIVEKSPAGQNAWTVYATWQSDSAGKVHTLVVFTPGPQEIRAKSTNASETPPETPYIYSGSFDC
jgi:subtilisin family serine protease